MFTFTKIALSDEKLLKSWFSKPHFQEWWGDADEEWRLVAEALETGEADMYLVSQGGENIAYIQSWPVAMARGRVDEVEEIWLCTLDDGAVGVDMSLAHEDRLGQGLGRKILTAFIAKLVEAGCRDIIIDPDIRNLRAIRCYQAARFQRIGQYPEQQGGTLLMRWKG